MATAAIAALYFSPSLLRPTTNPNPALRLNRLHCARRRLSPISFSLQNPKPSSFSSSTRTLTSLFALAKFLLPRFVSHLPPPPTPYLSLSGPLFFAAASAGGRMSSPVTVIASGLSKWLDIYSGVLMVRVLLSWFPNIPWEQQPLSAIRDLCDPYLNIFRNIIPPVLGQLDVSPLLAFTVLGILASIMRGN